MKLPLSWLKEYINSGLSAAKLVEALTMSGSKVDGIEEKGDDSVIEIEVTTNRPDCLSILGLANEVAAISGRPVKVPAAYRAPLKSGKSKRSFNIVVEDKKACPRYTGRIIENVCVKPTPAKFARFLELMGTRPVSNVVDATNFVLFESGQPLHAFDLDKLRGGRIVVRRSRKGERLLGIDGVPYELDDKTLVIADAEGPVAIAGVIGGKLTEVTDKTKNILLESAFFDLAVVRQAAKKYKIGTESSYRFERGVNPTGVPLASKRAAELIEEWAGGQDTSGLLDKNYLGKAKGGKIILGLERLGAVLGVEISQKRVTQILKSLSLDARAAGKKGVALSRTPARKDLETEEDLIEEVLRIEGFEKIPALLPPTRYEGAKVESVGARRAVPLQRFLTAQGFQEIITYSLLSTKTLTDCGFIPERCAKIANPVSAEQEYLRPLLLPGMLQSVVYNIHRKVPSLWFFEIGKRFLREDCEETALGLLLYGGYEENWRRKGSVSYFDLKGALENVFAFLGLESLEWREGQAGNFYEYSAEILWQGKPLAFIGSLAPQILRRLDIPHELFYAEMSLEECLSFSPPVRRVKPVPRFPSVRRDIAFVIDESTPVKSIQDLIRAAGAPFLKEVDLFDQYSGKNIPTGRRSLAFSLAYQKDTGTFTDEEIHSLQGRVGDALKKEFSVEFR